MLVVYVLILAKLKTWLSIQLCLVFSVMKPEVEN
jgi:hypothetical protein